MITSTQSLLLILSLGVRLSVEVCAPDCSVVDPGISVRDPTDCTRYYVCLSIHDVNTPSKDPVECPSGQYFNDGHTVPRCDPINGAPATFCSDLCDPCIPDCNGNNAGTAQPNPLSCSKYDVCLAETGLFLEFDCPSDAPYFDFRKSKCQTDSTLCYDYCDMCLPHCTYDGQLLIDPTDCHQFYLCTPPTIALFLCPNSLIFNRSTGECEANAECEILCETERR
ncbi:uncharacterized protein [Cherax quadricarinatus]|uniref:uncharacterized protein isoform X2 n=1 Tax=Cherax quadricarinatus TaxID=27406 RepID=UPI00387E8EA5